MTKKQIIRMVAFILAACCVLVLLSDLFEQENTSYNTMRYKEFRGLQKNTLDAVFIGTSGVDRYWIGAKAYEEYGMTVYPLASDGMPSWVFLNQIEYVCDTQDPQLIIVDARAFGQIPRNASRMDVMSRRVLDAMPFMSLRYIETAFKTMDVIYQEHPEEGKFAISMLLPFVKYHTMWEDDDFSIHEQLSTKQSEYMGFLMSPTLSVRLRSHKSAVYDTKITEEIGDIHMDSLNSIIEYAREKGLKLLFVDTPQKKNEEQTARANTLTKILADRGIPYLNYCLTDENAVFTMIPELSWEDNFYNSGHVNYYGAEKFTARLAAYLNENYEFPDRRQDEKARKDWEGVYDRIKSTIKEYEIARDAKKEEE